MVTNPDADILDPVAWHERRSAILWSVQGGMRGETLQPGDPWWNTNPGRQPEGHVVLQVIRSGQAVLRRHGVDHEIGPGQVFLFSYGEDSAYGWPAERPARSEPIVTDFLVLSGAGLTAHWELLSRRAGPVLDIPKDHAVMRLFQAFVLEARHGRSVAPTEVARLVDELGAAIEAAQAVGRSPVDSAINRILADPWIDHPLKALAHRHGCSREHLVRLFQSRVGDSPARWLRGKRLERAVDLLRETELPILEVARACGVGSVHRLARWTREVHGLPPEALRQSLRPS